MLEQEEWLGDHPEFIDLEQSHYGKHKKASRFFFDLRGRLKNGVEHCVAILLKVLMKFTESIAARRCVFRDFSARFFGLMLPEVTNSVQSNMFTTF